MYPKYCLVCGAVLEDEYCSCEHPQACRECNTMSAFGKTQEEISATIKSGSQPLEEGEYLLVVKRGEDEKKVPITDTEKLRELKFSIILPKDRRRLIVCASGGKKISLNAIGGVPAVDLLREDGICPSLRLEKVGNAETAKKSVGDTSDNGNAEDKKTANGTSKVQVNPVPARKTDEKSGGFNKPDAKETAKPTQIAQACAETVKKQEPIAAPGEIIVRGMRFARQTLVSSVNTNAAAIYGEPEVLSELLTALDRNRELFLAGGKKSEAAFSAVYDTLGVYPPVKLFAYMLQSPEAELTGEKYALTLYLGAFGKVVFSKKSLREIRNKYKFYSYASNKDEAAIFEMLTDDGVLRLLTAFYLQAVLTKTMKAGEREEISKFSRDNDLSQAQALRQMLLAQ